MRLKKQSKKCTRKQQAAQATSFIHDGNEFLRRLKELPGDDAYYLREFGLDRVNYLIHQEMQARTAALCTAYLDAENNASDSYDPFFV